MNLVIDSPLPLSLSLPGIYVPSGAMASFLLEAAEDDRRWELLSGGFVFS